MLDFGGMILLCAPGVHPDTMQRLIQVESATNPYAIGIVGAHLPSQPNSLKEAVTMARWLNTHHYNYSVGLAQINTKNFAALGLDYVTAFDPCRNLQAASRVLTQCYRRALIRNAEPQHALRASFSCYESGNFKTGFKDDYVLKLVSTRTGRLPTGTHDNARRPSLGIAHSSLEFAVRNAQSSATSNPTAAGLRQIQER